MKYTAEEVRAMASDLRGAPGTSMIGTHISLPTARAVAIYEALCAYAERIKADEGAVTKLIVDTICNAALRHDNYGYETQDRVHAALLAIWPNPPAQAAQVDSANWFAGKYPTTTELAQPTDSGRVELERWGLPDATRMAKRCEDGYWTPWHVAQAAVDALAAQGQGEPVAEVCSLFELRWAGADSISSIAERNGIKVGDKLYAAPPIDLAAVREVIANHRSEAAKLSHDPESRDYLCEQADKLEAAIKGAAK